MNFNHLRFAVGWFGFNVVLIVVMVLSLVACDPPCDSNVCRPVTDPSAPYKPYRP